ncbi:MAG TPA: AMP-binding protein [Solirubrobacterales bacterium]|nr:AMP-binding protein [Solirubrobacterales bacterium]
MNFVSDVLERFPSARPALLAIDANGERRVWHFGELIAMSAGISGALAARGVGRGDVVMTLAGNRIEWVLTMLATWRMGAVALPMSTQLRSGDLQHRVGVANPSVCVGEEELLGSMPDGVEYMTMADVEAVLDEDRPQETPASVADLAPEDPALIVFTSGTTGEPRAALHTASYLPAQRGQAENWVGSNKDDLVWVTTATGWSKSARNVFVAPWLTGAAALICDARFDPAERQDLCEREGVSVLCQAPTEYRMLAARGDLRPMPSLRRAISAGEPLGKDMLEAYREAWGLEVADGYGQTETGHVCGNHLGLEVKPGSMGMPLPGTEVRVADGELQVRAATCPTFFAGYIGDEDGPDLSDGGWWATGDLVSEDDDGHFFHEGRADDMITSSGYRIGPGEVESALLSHPAVAEAAAVSHPDPERGSVVRAVVVLRDGSGSDAIATELREHVKSVTAPYKAPRIVEFANGLPRTASGKLRRAELRAGAADSDLGP